MKRSEIIALDRAHVWHPYTPMDAWQTIDPIVVARAEGSRIFDLDGRAYLDGNAQWWTSALGHGHPRLIRALTEQAARFAHVSLAGVAHEPAARLAAELVAVAPRGLERVFFTDDGSTAIEAAVKMCAQAWSQLGAPKKTRFVAFDDAFHGESVGATSLGGVPVFKRAFAGVLFDCVRGSMRDFGRALEAIRGGRDEIAAVFVEPMIQAAGGMIMHDAARLRELRAACDEADALLVFDEVFTGYGRTGPMWASEHAGVAPDLMCLGKSFCPLLPMAAVLASDRVFRAFSGGRERAFLYGHTFCGNPLGAAVAREVLSIFRDEDILGGVKEKSKTIARAFAALGGRSLGMVGAVDLGRSRDDVAWEDEKYLASAGWRVYDEARARGAYLRPLGETVYVAPPLNISGDDLDELLRIVVDAVTMVRDA